MDEQQLVEQYLQRIPQTSPISGQVIIAFVGLPGTGKSHIAKILSQELNGMYIMSNDEIRRFLNQNGYPGSSPDREMLRKIAVAATDKLLENGVSYIHDADILTFTKYAKQRAEETGFKLMLVRVTANEEVALERLQAREGRSDSASTAGAADYWERKAVHDQTSIDQADIFFTVNTSSNFESQLNTLLGLIRQSIF